MNVEIAPLITAVALAFIGYLITYWNSLQLANRKEQLDLVNKRINEFYGPLYVTTQAGNIAYKALLKKLGREKIFDRTSKSPLPDEKVIAEWRTWLLSVFMPLNELREKIILEDAYLIREEKMPECFFQFITHVSAYKAILKKWEMNDFSEYIPLISFPAELDSYAETSYKELKAEQLRLIGKISSARSKR